MEGGGIIVEKMAQTIEGTFFQFERGRNPFKFQGRICDTRLLLSEYESDVVWEK